MKRYVVLTCLLFVAGSLCWAADELPLKDNMDQVNYSIGYQIGGDFKKQNVEMRSEAMLQGIQDALKENKPLLTKKEMNQVLVDLKKRIVKEQTAQKKKILQEGQDFLAANAKKDGVITLPSGLQYRTITTGKGKSPSLNDQVTVNYIGTRLDGTEFDSSARHEKPSTFPVKGLIKGWTEALQLMQEGDKWQLFIPADLAYGERGPLADQTLLFEIELLEVLEQQAQK